MDNILEYMDHAWPSSLGAIDFLYHNEVLIQQREEEELRRLGRAQEQWLQEITALTFRRQREEE